jgi:hypothetical protein
MLPQAFSIDGYSWDSPILPPKLCNVFSPVVVQVVCDTPHVWNKIMHVLGFLRGPRVVSWIHEDAELSGYCVYLRSSMLATFLVSIPFSRRNFLISNFSNLMSSKRCLYWISPKKQLITILDKKPSKSAIYSDIPLLSCVLYQLSTQYISFTYHLFERE